MNTGSPLRVKCPPRSGTFVTGSPPDPPRPHRLTLAQLADDRGLPERTVAHDIERLRRCGVLITVTPGRGGGAIIEPAPFTGPGDLGLPEIAALMASLAPRRCAGSLLCTGGIPASVRHNTPTPCRRVPELTDHPPDRLTRNTVYSAAHSTIVQVGDLHGDVRVQHPQPQGRPLPPVREWPPCRSVDPVTAGVHHARAGGDGSSVPPYVLRDQDAELRQRVRQAGKRGGFVLVMGRSSVGKSRAALEAVRTALPRHRFLAPGPGTDLTALPSLVARRRWNRRLVLWLDDIEDHLGLYGIDRYVINRLVRLGVAVVATVNYGAAEQLRGTGGGGRSVLEATEPVHLKRLWSKEEAKRAERKGDERLDAAVGSRENHGVAEYLTAGPHLWNDWHAANRPRSGGDVPADQEDGHPRGHALVAAAVDLARLEVQGSFSAGLLEELHEHYLPDSPGMEPEPLREAWRWATEVRQDVDGLLSRADEEGAGWRPFFYLVENSAAVPRDVPGAVWEAALARADSAPERVVHALLAYYSDHQRHAADALRPVVEKGNFAIGAVMEEADFEDFAEFFIQVAVDVHGFQALPNIACIYDRQFGKRQRAFELARRAAEQGSFDGQVLLAQYCEEAEDLDGRQGWLRRAAEESGEPWVVEALAYDLYAQGEYEEATRWMRRVVEESRKPQDMQSLGFLLRDQGLAEEAEQWLKAAAAKGEPEAAAGLAELLDDQGWSDRAEQLFLERAENGSTEYLSQFGRLLWQQGRLEEAEEILSAAHKKDPENEFSAIRLGYVLIDQGRFPEAEAVVRPFAEKGASAAAGIIATARAGQNRRLGAAWWSYRRARSGFVGWRDEFRTFRQGVRVSNLLNPSFLALVGYMPSLLLLGAFGELISGGREPGAVPYFLIFLVLCGALFFVPWIRARRSGPPVRLRLLDAFMAILASLSFAVSSTLPGEDVPWWWIPIQVILLLWVLKWFLFPPQRSPKSHR